MTDPRRVDEPKEGFFLIRLVRGGVPVAARIGHDERGWFVIIDGVEKRPDADPWQAEDMSRVWHYGREIDQVEYDYTLARAAHARQHLPGHPAADPTKPVDLNDVPPLF